MIKIFQNILQNKSKKGFYVFCPQGFKPKVIHTCFNSALKEAKRLQNMYPELTFQILEIKKELIPAKQPAAFNDEIPF